MTPPTEECASHPVSGAKPERPKFGQNLLETTRISFPDILISATGSVQMGLVCLIGLGLWGIRHPVTAFAYAPLSAFALLNFVLGNRAVFYSAPILWFGAAFSISYPFHFSYFTAPTQPYLSHFRLMWPTSAFCGPPPPSVAQHRLLCPTPARSGPQQPNVADPRHQRPRGAGARVGPSCRSGTRVDPPGRAGEYR